MTSFAGKTLENKCQECYRLVSHKASISITTVGGGNPCRRVVALPRPRRHHTYLTLRTRILGLSCIGVRLRPKGPSHGFPRFESLGVRRTTTSTTKPALVARFKDPGSLLSRSIDILLSAVCSSIIRPLNRNNGCQIALGQKGKAPNDRRSQWQIHG